MTMQAIYMLMLENAVGDISVEGEAPVACYFYTHILLVSVPNSTLTLA